MCDNVPKGIPTGPHCRDFRVWFLNAEDSEDSLCEHFIADSRLFKDSESARDNLERVTLIGYGQDVLERIYKDGEDLGKLFYSNSPEEFWNGLAGVIVEKLMDREEVMPGTRTGLAMLAAVARMYLSGPKGPEQHADFERIARTALGMEERE